MKNENSQKINGALGWVLKWVFGKMKKEAKKNPESADKFVVCMKFNPLNSDVEYILVDSEKFDTFADSLKETEKECGSTEAELEKIQSETKTSPLLLLPE